MVGTSISENLIIAHDIATTHREGVYCYQLIVCVLYLECWQLLALRPVHNIAYSILLLFISMHPQLAITYTAHTKVLVLHYLIIYLGTNIIGR